MRRTGNGGVVQVDPVMTALGLGRCRLTPGVTPG